MLWPIAPLVLTICLSLTLCLTREDIGALKRLIRELFAEQLGIKARLEASEASAARELEAGDEYSLPVPGSSSSSSSSRWPRSEVRLSGAVSVSGALPWSQVRFLGEGFGLEGFGLPFLG
jgi:hypothetical protein